ncbi:bifunctional Ribosomal protein L36e domain superfamily/Ribosomal protein L36e [Babesia duncani]|uniref:Bifunctional Ribosomal protein L36e domain superfamily/Ribosomal protein L36e n=1 Tax=Babesia duncani TaxID=323732 RepID=A0AAD9PPE4_9APIC|nr:bifunctional Ribosomal protein L36e domain superfamily/Ribosomal protein L36e [Babesia duncani]
MTSLQVLHLITMWFPITDIWNAEHNSLNKKNRKIYIKDSHLEGMVAKQDIKKSESRSGLAAGPNKGHLVTPIPLLKSVRPSRSKGRKTTRNCLVSEVIREVCGFAPYERHMIEMVKIGTAASYKRALKFAKKRLGTLRRAKAKREEIIRVVDMQRRRRN